MVPALISSYMPKLPYSNLEWGVIQKKVGPFLWLMVISTILVLFVMDSSTRFSSSVAVSHSGGLKQGSARSLPANDTDATSPELSSGDIGEVCDISEGKWVEEPRGSIYTNTTCPTMPDIKNCGKYGKDQSYVYWRWQPKGCDIPRFEPETFLGMVRGKKMAVIGDSLARDHVESLLCLLSQAEIPSITFRDEIDKCVTWNFPEHNFTLMVLWTEYIVETIPRIENGTVASYEIHLDKASRNWTEKLPGVDYAILSGGNWFFRAVHLYEGGKLIGCINCWEQNLTRYEVTYAIRRVVRTGLQFISTCKECEGLTTFLRTYTPSHFQNGSWFDGGYCNRTSPLDESQIRLTDVAWEIRNIQREEIARVRENHRGGKVKFGVLDITKAIMMRADGHPEGHWTKRAEGRANDCLHWCLPGPVDMWSDVLLATLMKNSLS
ncbi:protein ALTERED XYLOGLUCAN 4-like [Zingiber officinale]|uniref:Trichome birefringence-like N-terminal domain-containing protein n=1 Tax=Zingiber officinale TaxID=94328 RepID=A0A8J5BY40_ZINOF|nr:protein ALTERED XYLOGLUCAN 4-like [Zingiber officinale]KAG6467456.1 hypothetical protein ZIOFF_074712 [Zingiber officinale]